MHPESERAISKLLHPERVIVVGASDTAGKLGTEITANLLSLGNERVVLVNTRRTEMFGKECYHSISRAIEMQGIPDVAYIVVPPEHALGAVMDCVDAGIPSSVVMSSGIADWTPDTAQYMLNRGHLMLGPNCLGVHSNGGRISFNSSLIGDEGPLVFLSQSGSFTEVFLLAMKKRQCATSFAVSTGDEFVAGIELFLEYASSLAGITSIAVYAEQIRRPPAFYSACRTAVNGGKSVFVYKAGNTEEGRKAAFSHTGALSGDAEVYGAFLEKCGAAEAANFGELVNATASYAKIGRIEGKRAASVSGPGGLCVNLSDALSLHSFSQPEFSEGLCRQLRNELRGSALIRNPLDLTMAATKNVELYARALRAIAASGEYDIAIIGAPTSYSTREFLSAITEVAREIEMPIAVVWMGETEEIERACSMLWKAGIPVFGDAETAAASLSLLANTQPADGETVFCEHAGGRSLNIVEMQLLLGKYGIHLPIRTAESAAEARRTANEIGYPVVAKIYSEEGVHKGSSGLIEFWIRNDEELETAYEKLMHRAVEMSLADPIFTVSKQYTVKLELAVGSIHALQSHVVMFGAGGTMIEQLKGRAYALAPLSQRDAMQLLVKSGLDAEMERRGQAAVQKVCDLLSSCSSFITSEHVLEMDLNPVAVTEEGIQVLDARIMLGR